VVQLTTQLVVDTVQEDIALAVMYYGENETRIQSSSPAFFLGGETISLNFDSLHCCDLGRCVGNIVTQAIRKHDCLTCVVLAFTTCIEIL
jgi:hypothetical protein